MSNLPSQPEQPGNVSPDDARLLAAARERGYGSIREMFRADSAAALAVRTGPSRHLKSIGQDDGPP